jgi:hypothetical protein
MYLGTSSTCLLDKTPSKAISSMVHTTMNLGGLNGKSMPEMSKDK